MSAPDVDAVIARLREAAKRRAVSSRSKVYESWAFDREDLVRIVRESWSAASDIDWKALKTTMSRTVAEWAARQVMHVEQPPLSTVLCRDIDKLAVAAARECVYTEDGDNYWKCSACSYEVDDDHTEDTWAYCPHCGARITESSTIRGGG